MRDIEQKISPLVQSMFPSFYNEEGPNFIAFVKAYYEWLETNFQLLELEDNTNFNVGDTIYQQDVRGKIIAYVDTDILVQIDGFNTFKCFNICSELIPVTSTSGGSTYISRGGSSRRLSPLYMSRNLPKLRDIDKTLDLFVVSFKEKYLKNIEFDTSTNKRLLIKNSLDLYRSKGTERSIDLFFRLIYGIKSDVVFPGERLFQLSAAEWYAPSYIEISSESVSRNIELVGKQITGVTSGASAFVEKYVKRKISTGFIHLLYISNIQGQFIKNELLKGDLLYPDSPKILGSLYSVDIKDGGNNYKIGDIIKFTSSTGDRGLARVSAIKDNRGVVDFELIDGGWGYTISSASSPYSETDRTQTLVADKVLSLDNVSAGNTVSSLALISAGSGYNSTDIVKIVSPTINATARIVTAGGGAISDVIVTSPGSGFFTDNPTIEILDVGGGPSAGAGAQFAISFEEPKQYFRVFDKVEQGTTKSILTHFDNTGVITLSFVSQNLSQDDVIYQIGGASARVIEVTSSSLLSTTIRVKELIGVFSTSKPVFVKDKPITARFVKLNLSISIAESNTFTLNSTVYSKYSGTTGTLISYSSGFDANYEVGTISNQDTAYLNTDRLLANNISNVPYLSLPISSFNFGFPKNTDANKDNVIFSALTYDPFEVGTIKTLIDINPGENYSTDPKTLTYQPYMIGADKLDYIFTIEDLDRDFSVGEQIVQSYNESRTTIQFGSDTQFYVGEKIYTANSSNPLITTAFVKEVDNDTNRITVSGFTSPITSSQNVYSYSNTVTNIAVSSASIFNENIVAKGMVISSNDTNVYVKRIQSENLFRLNQNIIGATTGATAKLLSIEEDTSNRQMGFNADISAFALSTQDGIATVRIIDSGLGYEDGQDLVFRSDTNPSTGTAVASTEAIGRGLGYYKTSKGFLSSISKLHDGDYYQEYSYEILSRIPIDKYSTMFKRVMHTAGTRFFGSILVDTITDRTVSIISSQLISDTTSPYVIEDRYDIDVQDRTDLDIEIRG